MFFDDFRLGIVTGESVVDVSAEVAAIPRAHPQDVIRGVIEQWPHYRPVLRERAGRGRHGLRLRVHEPDRRLASSVHALEPGDILATGTNHRGLKRRPAATPTGRHEPMSAEREKQVAAEAAAELVESGMTVGLGTGSTVAFLLPALAKRSLDILCAATSPRTEHAARELGLRIEDVTSIDRFDITIDGADQIAPDGWLVKGGGGAHTREKIVAGAADRFVVIADSSKPVPALHAPVPLELLSFGLRATLRRVAPATLRDIPLSPDGGVIADYHGPVTDPAELSARLSATPGVVAHGLFPPQMVATVFVGRGESADRTDFTPRLAAAAETNTEVIARIARDREPVRLTIDDILAARDEGRR
jgi:ribose 5-phosphate isomerase A